MAVYLFFLRLLLCTNSLTRKRFLPSSLKKNRNKITRLSSITDYKMISSSESILVQNMNQIKEIGDTLKNIREKVLSVKKSGPKTEAEKRLNIAQLKKNKLEVLALVARSQAVLANMEVLIAESEIEELTKNVKRKCETDSDSSAKKSKVTEGCKASNDKARMPRKNNKKTTGKSANNSKSKGHVTPKDKLAETALTTNVTQKNDNVNKENNNYKPTVGKQLIVLSRPPIRNNSNCNQNGYLPDAQSLRHNRIENSIYNQAENIEQFAKTMSLSTNESFQKRYSPFYGQPGFCNQNVTNYQTTFNQKQMTVCNQNMADVTDYQTTFNQKQMTVCNQNMTNVNQINENSFNQNQIAQYNQSNFICQKNSLQNSGYQTEMQNEKFPDLDKTNEVDYSKFYKTTNEIFKEILNMKGKQIKTEKENAPDDYSEKTLVIDLFGYGQDLNTADLNTAA